MITSFDIKNIGMKRIMIITPEMEVSFKIPLEMNLLNANRFIDKLKKIIRVLEDDPNRN